MLDPYNRRHFIETLRPPPDSLLDGAIGTTFSLDLLALLTAPVAFTYFDWEPEGADSGRPPADPLVLLEALRRYADRMAIFCEAGRIAVPARSHLLYSNLEDTVVEVVAPLHGAFHPKLWLLRFLGPEGAVSYRLICLSRNLTFDRSWDTMLVLEGRLAEHNTEQVRNQPLQSFIAALPGMAMRGAVCERIQHLIDLMAAELPRVNFELPPGFESMDFCPLGLPNHTVKPFELSLDRVLVMSPFIDSRTLRAFAEQGAERILISRPEALQAQDPLLLGRYTEVYTLKPEADPEPGVAEDGAIEPEHPPSNTLTGLHAKLFIGEVGELAHIWTGSANATNAALTRNVEFMVELVGPRALCGINALLGADGSQGLRTLLEPFDPQQAGIPDDAIQQRLEEQFDIARRRIAAASLIACVQPADADQLFTLQIEQNDASPVVMSDDLRITCWPITLSQSRALPLALGQAVAASFVEISLEALTAFLAVQVRVSEGSHVFTGSFVLNLPLRGAPPHRRQRLLRSLLQNRDQVLRFLMLLLADTGANTEGAPRLARLLKEVHGTGTAPQTFGLPLFEAMVRTLDRDPERIAYIAQVIDELRATPDDAQLLPENFESVWQPIYSAYMQARQRQ